MNTTEHKTIKIRRTGFYKYVEGSIKHNKDTGYFKNYYNIHKCINNCEVCGVSILEQSKIRHQLTKKCLNNKTLVE